MIILNNSILAVIYYNLLERDKYNMNSILDRKKANSNMLNSKHIDIAILEEAYRQYKLLLDSEFETLKDKTNDKKQAI